MAVATSMETAKRLMLYDTGVLVLLWKDCNYSLKLQRIIDGFFLRDTCVTKANEVNNSWFLDFLYLHHGEKKKATFKWFSLIRYWQNIDVC